MKCAIRWIDSHGNPTPDDNDAIGYIIAKHRLVVPDAVNGYIDYERTEDLPICADHAKRLAETDMHRWHFVPITSFCAPSGRVYSRVAWTGGDTPTSEVRRNADYRYLRRMFFREQVRECGGLDLWACAGTSALERARIFWNAATLDAWRTFSSHGGGAE